MAFQPQKGIAGLFDGGLQGGLVRLLLADHHSLPLSVGRRDLFHRNSAADGIADVGFTHAAHHAVNADNGFKHGILLLMLRQAVKLL